MSLSVSIKSFSLHLPAFVLLLNPHFINTLYSSTATHSGGIATLENGSAPPFDRLFPGTEPIAQPSSVEIGLEVFEVILQQIESNTGKV